MSVNVHYIIDHDRGSYYINLVFGGRATCLLVVCFSSAENIAVYIWDQLKSRLPDNLLYEVKVHETDKNVTFYRGETE